MSLEGGITLGSVSHTVQASGLSQATVVQIVHDRRRLVQGKQFTTRTKCYGSRKCTISDEFDREAFHQQTHHLYQQKVDITLTLTGRLEITHINYPGWNK